METTLHRQSHRAEGGTNRFSSICLLSTGIVARPSGHADTSSDSLSSGKTSLLICLSNQAFLSISGLRIGSRPYFHYPGNPPFYYWHSSSGAGKGL
jgi:hypothetical protein